MTLRKTRYFLILAVILMACAVWVFGPAREKKPQKPFREAPEFQLRDFSGKVHRLSEARGQWVILHFWAAWCPPCLSEIPELLEFAEHFQGESRLKVIAISMDEHWPEAEKVLPTSRLPREMLSLLDGGAQTPDAYGTYRFPESYLIDPQGQILAKWVGGQPWNSPPMEKLIREEISKVH